MLYCRWPSSTPTGSGSSGEACGRTRRRRRPSARSSSLTTTLRRERTARRNTQRRSRSPSYRGSSCARGRLASKAPTTMRRRRRRGGGGGGGGGGRARRRRGARRTRSVIVVVVGVLCEVDLKATASSGNHHRSSTPIPRLLTKRRHRPRPYRPLFLPRRSHPRSVRPQTSGRTSRAVDRGLKFAAPNTSHGDTAVSRTVTAVCRLHVSVTRATELFLAAHRCGGGGFYLCLPPLHIRKGGKGHSFRGSPRNKAQMYWCGVIRRDQSPNDGGLGTYYCATCYDTSFSDDE